MAYHTSEHFVKAKEKMDQKRGVEEVESSSVNQRGTSKAIPPRPVQPLVLANTKGEIK